MPTRLEEMTTLKAFQSRIKECWPKHYASSTCKILVSGTKQKIRARYENKKKVTLKQKGYVLLDFCVCQGNKTTFLQHF